MDDEGYRKVGVTLPGVGHITLRGDRKTRRAKLAMLQFAGVVYASLNVAEGPMAADQVIADRFFQFYAKSREWQFPEARKPQVEVVSKACEELLDTGWVTRVDDDPYAYEVVRPRPLINQTEALDEILGLIDGSACSAALKPAVTEILSRLNR